MGELLVAYYHPAHTCPLARNCAAATEGEVFRLVSTTPDASLALARAVRNRYLIEALTPPSG